MKGQQPPLGSAVGKLHNLISQNLRRRFAVYPSTRLTVKEYIMLYRIHRHLFGIVLYDYLYGYPTRTNVSTRLFPQHGISYHGGSMMVALNDMMNFELFFQSLAIFQAIHMFMGGV